MSDEAEIRERFMAVVYEWLSEDGTNSRANHIIGAFDDATASLTAALAAMTAERDAMRERAEAAERDLDNAQPCFACKSFERNGGPCFGSGRCRTAALRSIICNEPYDDTSEWKWRGPVAENRRAARDDDRLGNGG